MKNEKEKQIAKSSRKWLATINNPEKHGLDHDAIKNILSMIENLSYWCMCDEIGSESGTYHTHLFLFRPAPISFDYMKKLFPAAHFNYPYGSTQDNRDYVGKFASKHNKREDGSYEYIDTKGKLHSGINYGNTFEEFGECPIERQGQRNDMAGLYKMIKDDCSDFEIIEQNPSYMNKLETIGRVREMLRYEKFKAERRLNLHVEYWFGAPGVGKSRGVRDLYGDANIYVIDDYRHPWDNYSGEDVVLFDDFESDRYRLNDLLRWLDVYPLQLPCRYNNKTACYTKVFFTANTAFDQLYKHYQKDEPMMWDAFCRRFHQIRQFDTNGSVKIYETVDQYLFWFKVPAPKDEFIQLSLAEQQQINELFGGK